MEKLPSSCYIGTQFCVLLPRAQAIPFNFSNLTHMKKITLFFLLLWPFVVRAQQKEAPPVPIPMKNGIVCYEQTYTADSISKDTLYARALQWYKRSFPAAKEDLKLADAHTGEINGSGIFKVVTSDGGNYYWLKFAVNIVVKDGQYTFKAFQYYEKPIEKGITNDYSKIEYRWWDYRQGKPWSVEDKPLFKGLNENTLALMKQLDEQMRLPSKTQI